MSKRELEAIVAEMRGCTGLPQEWADRIEEELDAYDTSSAVGDLLAVIHRDGGHYEAAHGREKAARDAIQLWYAALTSPSAETPRGEDSLKALVVEWTDPRKLGSDVRFDKTGNAVVAARQHCADQLEAALFLPKPKATDK